jgi:hypothetical protein
MEITMVILDTERDACIVWLINSPIIGYENKVTRIKGSVSEICKSLVSRLAVYEDTKNQWGNNIQKLYWADNVYLDVSGFGLDYKYILNNNYDLDVVDIRGINADSIIPERMHLKR